ncbi:MAG: deiodinase family protein [Aureliella sp.]
MKRILCMLAVALGIGGSTLFGQITEPVQAVTDGGLTSEAQAAVKQLRASLAPDSEAIAMLEDILQGSRMSADDGWFRLAKAQSRFGWESVLKKFDGNSDGVVGPNEFSGSRSDFRRLDRDEDRSLTSADFDWSANSLTPSAGTTLFFMADSDANGKVTAAEFSELFSRLAGEEGDFLALDDLRERFNPPPAAAREQRPDRPNRSTLVLGLKNQEIGSLQPGPQLGEVAPDFTLNTLDGRQVTLSKEVGEKPIVLIFGNFTCGPFRSQAGNIEKLAKRYEQRANFYLVYVREAHPSDGWWMLSNQRVGIDLPQPKDDAGRRAAAATCQKHLDLSIPFLVDTVDDRVGATYSGMPNRLYLIDSRGRVAFKNGRGPFGFHPRQLEQALVLLLNE